jgi:hypothetical protein
MKNITDKTPEICHMIFPSILKYILKSQNTQNIEKYILIPQYGISDH